MVSKNVTSAASRQYMLEVPMSTIYHKNYNFSTTPYSEISHGIKIVFPRKKTMAPLKFCLTYSTTAITLLALETSPQWGDEGGSKGTHEKHFRRFPPAPPTSPQQGDSEI